MAACQAAKQTLASNICHRIFEFEAIEKLGIKMSEPHSRRVDGGWIGLSHTKPSHEHAKLSCWRLSSFKRFNLGPIVKRSYAVTQYELVCAFVKPSC